MATGAGPPLREDQAPAEYIAEGRDPAPTAWGFQTGFGIV